MLSLRSSTLPIITEVRIFQVSKNANQFYCSKKIHLKTAKQFCPFSTKKLRFESIKLDTAIAMGNRVEKEA